jgi:hypothetical protein
MSDEFAGAFFGGAFVCGCLCFIGFAVFDGWTINDCSFTAWLDKHKIEESSRIEDLIELYKNDIDPNTGFPEGYEVQLPKSEEH